MRSKNIEYSMINVHRETHKILKGLACEKEITIIQLVDDIARECKAKHNKQALAKLEKELA